MAGRLQVKKSFNLGVCAAALLAATPALAQTTGTIYWDQYAVPHIYAPTIPSVIQGLGYAQMENHAETALNLVAQHRGMLSAIYGAGDGNRNIINDTNVFTYGIPARAQQWYQQGGALQQQYLQAFCKGINEYAAKHGDTIDPRLRKLLPVVPADILAGEQDTIWFTFLPETSQVPALIQNWLATGATQPPPPAKPPLGSNGWAIGPSKLQSGNGNAVLMGNPHLPWGAAIVPGQLPGRTYLSGIYHWIEANLVVGDPNAPTLNAQGVTFIGGPFIGIGFNDNLGWTHTNNTIKNADLYLLTLDSTGTKYLFGGSYLPLVHTTATIQVLQADGVTLLPQKIDIYASIHGPVVAFNSGRTAALALRVPNLTANHLLTQYWQMITAQNVSQFMAAEAEQQMPFFNTMYADNGGNLFYLFGGGQPNRGDPGVPFSQFQGILDGSNPSLLWTSTLPFSQLPQALNPAAGFIANSNNPPWNSAFTSITPPVTVPAGLNPKNFPAWISPNFMDFRPQHGTDFLALPFKFTFDQILGAKMSTEMVLADRIVGDLITFANNSGDSTAKAAATILAAWDHTAEATSIGGLLFEDWYNRIVVDIHANPPTIVADTTDSIYYAHPKFAVPWDAKNPFNTPSGLDPVNTAQMLTELDNAYNDLQQNFASVGGARAPWGALHKTTLVTRAGLQDEQTIFPPWLTDTPNSGTDDIFGPLRVVDSAYVMQLGQFISYGGDGWVQLVSFTSTGAVGGTLLTYGNASRPNSPHITDQQSFYNSKTLKPLVRDFATIKKTAVAVENY